MAARRWRVFDVAVPTGWADDADLTSHVATRLGLEPADVLSVQLVRKSLDARRHSPRWVLTVDAILRDTAPVRAGVARDARVRELVSEPETPTGEGAPVLGRQPLVVGMGPAGIFAALALARKGYRPLLIDRGKDVRRRWKDVRAYWRDGTLDAESNVVYGEGGAGTFSDGKVYTRRNDPRNAVILETLARVGRAPDLLTSARPHLGTNRLSRALLALRPELEDAGVTLRFDARLESLAVEGGRVTGAVVDGERLDTDAVFLAAGHSARDVHELLIAAGVRLEARAFAVGARNEHEQKLIDAAQYVDPALAEELGAASYMLTFHGKDGLSAHTFCTCPGGEVVAASTESDGLTVNGMSYSQRNQPFCNSAIVVEVSPAECGEGVLAGVAFQRLLEQRACEAGGGGQGAPAQRVTDFLAGRASSGAWPSSYRLGIRGSDLAGLLPPRVVTAMRLAIRDFGRRIAGFDREGHLIAVEARTTSPVRVTRDPTTHQSVTTAGLFPMGEGAGYAGGIVSAASDGLRAVEHVGPAAAAVA